MQRRSRPETQIITGAPSITSQNRASSPPEGSAGNSVGRYAIISIVDFSKTPNAERQHGIFAAPVEGRSLMRAMLTKAAPRSLPYAISPLPAGSECRLPTRWRLSSLATVEWPESTEAV